MDIPAGAFFSPPKDDVLLKTRDNPDFGPQVTVIINISGPYIFLSDIFSNLVLPVRRFSVGGGRRSAGSGSQIRSKPS